MNKNNIWKALLQLATLVKDYPQKIKFCALSFNKASFYIAFDQLPSEPKDGLIVVFLQKEDQITIPNATSLYIKNYIESQLIQTANCEAEALELLLKYIPYCFLSVLAKAEKRAISVAHFAQSLDGKIATHLGDSKWIGNEENLIHAHRMRALCDAILIGKETLHADQPSLTVRKVEGKNPRRVVIGSPDSNYDCLIKADQTNQILLIGKKASLVNGHIQYFQMDSENGKIKSKDILSLLYKQGLHSVYIEGGAKTTSNFLKDQCIDILQLHIAPLVFGSGIQATVLPQIDQVGESIQFSCFHFQNIGDAVMFVGQVKMMQ